MHRVPEIYAAENTKLLKRGYLVLALGACSPCNPAADSARVHSLLGALLSSTQKVSTLSEELARIRRGETIADR